MPHASHRLDLQLVPRGEDAIGRVRRALSGLRDRGVVDAEGWGSEQAGWLVPGGFVRILADVHEAPRLWGNQQGGFQARCPSCGAGVVRALPAAIRSGGVEPVVCAACGAHASLDEVHFTPPAAFGPAALTIADAESADLSPEGQAWADEVLGSWARVWRRT